jgi:hypothetical protein
VAIALIYQMQVRSVNETEAVAGLAISTSRTGACPA